ncbi:hypothetical protein BGX31_003772 [Mortierella sp. GBA43]|nr:hypothetical protein BGX31_003772 [Mortierella sp. GBA43]
MNSPTITSRANPKSRRTRSREDPTTPLIRSIGQTTSERRKKEEAEQQVQRLHVVSSRHCWSIYAILTLLYLAVAGTVYVARRSDAFVPPLPDMVPGQTAQDLFNPHTAWEHLEAITTTSHPFNSRANTDVTKAYILDQFKLLQAEAVAIGRHNVRYYDGVDNSTWIQQEESEPSDGESLEPETLVVVQGDNLVMWIGGVTESVEEGIPVKIEIGFDQQDQAALLISAHYDSVPTSYGKTDDGGGVAVALALIRHFIHHPVQHTLIFNINNMEEIGMFGAAAFMGPVPDSTTEFGVGHPWKRYVRAFVNLEGGGSGGPSLLFRATDHDIIRHYADYAPFPHASVFANDVFQLDLIQSDTDYSIYIQHGLPGLDIAFYQRRAMYHTITDDLPIQSLFHMGSNAQATITGLCNSDYLDTIRPIAALKKGTDPSTWLSGKSVFYDLLGKHMVFAKLSTWFLLNVLVLGVGLLVLALIVIHVARAIKRCQENSRHARSAEQNQIHSLRNVLDSSSQSITGYSDDGYSTITPRYGNSRQHGRYSDSMDGILPGQPKWGAIARTTGLVALIVVFDLLAVFAAAAWQSHTNSLARFSHPWLVLLEFAGILLIVQTLVVYIITAIEASVVGPVPIVHGATQWTLAIGIWWWIVMLVVGTGVAGWFEAGSLYGTSALAGCSGLAALFQILFNYANTTEGIDSTRIGWVVVLAIGLIYPGITILDLTAVAVFMTSQSLIPNDIGTMVEPFSAQDPASLYYFQYYNQTARTSYVELRTDAGVGYLSRMMQDVPTHGDDDKCNAIPLHDSSFAESCRYTPVRQVFEDDGEQQPVHAEWATLPKHGLDGWREGRLQVSAQDSRHCTVDLAETTPGRETQMWMDHGKVSGFDGDKWKDGSVLNHRAKTLSAYVRDWNRPWFVVVRVKDTEGEKGAWKPIPLKVTCMYNDWSKDQGYATVYNGIQRHISQWARIQTYERDLFSVGVDLEME